MEGKKENEDTSVPVSDDESTIEEDEIPEPDVTKIKEFLTEKSIEILDKLNDKNLKEKEERKATKRKRRAEESGNLYPFEKNDPHFNPELKHAKRSIKKLKVDLISKNKEGEDEEEEEEKEKEIDNSPLGIERRNMIEFLREHAPEEKFKELTKLFGISNEDLKFYINKYLMTFHRMGLVSQSIRFIMAKVQLSANDCKMGQKSVELFKERLTALCESAK